jgi:23S rRNA (uracil1939-C5)-methyltransferase
MMIMTPKTMQAQIHALSHDGRGIATINGKTTFVTGGLPGETLTCKLIKTHKRYNEAQAIDILIPSEHRITPPCPHFGTCGGCSMQHLAMAQQVAYKQAILLEQLKHFGKVTPETILSPITGAEFEYRRKARLGVRYTKNRGKLVVGFREKNSNSLTEITQCLVLHPSIGKHISDLQTVIAKLTQYEQIPQVEVAVSDEATALIFRHLQPLVANDLHLLQEFGEKFNLHIYLQPNPPLELTKLWPANNHLLLNYILPASKVGLPTTQTLTFHPQDFTQVNAEINLQMLKSALALLDLTSEDHVLDLFCGLGNFSLPIASYAKQVTGIEGSQTMVERAQYNAQQNGLTNTEFYAANLAAPNPNAAWLKKSYQKVLLDPPRTGAKEIIPLLPHKNIKKIVYVSCNPATLARDAAELVYTYRYKLKAAGAINMFPQTGHIEAITLFEK